MDKTKKILMIVLIVFVAIGIVKNPIAKTVVTIGATQVTGAPVNIKGFGLGIFRPGVRVKGFKLYNPKGFPKEPLMDIPEITVRYSPLALMRGKLHISLLVFNMKEMVVIKNKDGELNVDGLKFSQPQEKPAEATDKKAKPSKPMPMQIDEMRLNVERVVFKNYSKGEKPVILVYELALKDKTFKNIKSAQELAAVVTMQGLGPTALKSAKVYAAATILGAGLLPVGVAGVFIGKDSGTAEFNVSEKKLLKVTQKVITELGEIKEVDDAKGKIKAKVDGTEVTAMITKKGWNKSAIEVSARKLMIPKPEVANGVIYQLSRNLR